MAPPPRRKRRGGLVAGLVGVVVIVLAVAAGLLFVNRGNEGGAAEPGASVAPEFSEPTKAVDSWLNAMFILKDADKMLRYTCKREADRAEVDDAIKTVKQAEEDAKAAKLTMKVTWSKPAEASRDDEKATVTSTLKVVVGKNTQETAASFDVVFEKGWKVCDAKMK